MVAFETEVRIDRGFKKGFNVCVCVLLCSLLLFHINPWLYYSHIGLESLYKRVGKIVVQNLKEHLQTYSSLKGPVEVERNCSGLGRMQFCSKYQNMDYADYVFQD